MVEERDVGLGQGLDHIPARWSFSTPVEMACGSTVWPQAVFHLAASLGGWSTCGPLGVARLRLPGWSCSW